MRQSRWTMATEVAALYVASNGIYQRLLGDAYCWDEQRDARLYAGPYPVIAHPPCERWGRYRGGGPMLAKTPRQKKLGDDGGCFAAAIRCVRRYGGVLEHPEASHAWRAHDLLHPRWREGWIRAGDGLGYTCCVAQGNYGHRSRKLTWLYYVGKAVPPELDWSIPRLQVRLDDGYHSKEERAKAIKCRVLARLSHPERVATPEPFARLLVTIALGAR